MAAERLDQQADAAQRVVPAEVPAPAVGLAQGVKGLVCESGELVPVHLTGNVVAPTGGAVRRHMPFGEHARRMQQRKQRRAVLSQRRVDQESSSSAGKVLAKAAGAPLPAMLRTASTAETIPVTS